MLIAQILETSASQRQLLDDEVQNRQLDAMQRSLDELRAEVEHLRGQLPPIQ